MGGTWSTHALRHYRNRRHCRRATASSQLTPLTHGSCGGAAMSQQVHREYVVYDERQIYPEFVVTYRLDTESEENKRVMIIQRAKMSSKLMLSLTKLVAQNPFVDSGKVISCFLPAITLLISSLTAGDEDFEEDTRLLEEELEKVKNWNSEAPLAEAIQPTIDAFEKVINRAAAQVAEREFGSGGGN